MVPTLEPEFSGLGIKQPVLLRAETEGVLRRMKHQDSGGNFPFQLWLSGLWLRTRATRRCLVMGDGEGPGMEAIVRITFPTRV